VETVFEASQPVILPSFTVSADSTGGLVITNPYRQPVQVGWLIPSTSGPAQTQTVTVHGGQTVKVYPQTLSTIVFDATRHSSPTRGYSTPLTLGRRVRITTIYPAVN
jgi:hypothetical protein